MYNDVCYTYDNNGCIKINNNKLTSQKIEQFNEIMDKLIESNRNIYDPSNNKVYIFIFYSEIQPLYTAKELLKYGINADNLSVNYCSNFHAGKENDKFYTFDDINKELEKHKNNQQIPILVYDKYKNQEKSNQVHLVSMFFNQACANNQNEKEFIIVDSLLDYVEKDEQLFKGIESIFKDELNGKNEEQKKQFIRNKLKESSLYQYPFQSENNCGRFAVKFYARFANRNSLNKIRNKSRETLLEVSSEISDEVTQVTKKQEKRSVRQWDDNLVEKGYTKVNVGNKVFAVRIPKSDEIDFNRNKPCFTQYSNPDNKDENFYEKACHGQGILTGGLLLNLGVSREQLKEIVRNRGKQIEINIRDPIQSSSIGINTKINIDGKTLSRYGYSTNFGFIPKSPSLNCLNFEKIERQIKVNNNDKQVKNIKKHRRLSR